MSSRRDEPDDSNSVPRAVIHKQILDAAKAHPDASIERLADEVPGASPDLIERVLDEYGDPMTAEDAVEDGDERTESSQEPTAANESASHDDSQPAPPGDASPEGMSDTDSQRGTDPERALDDLTEQQRDILAEIRDCPDATQQEIADSFDVSQTTVSTNLNDIDGFDWEQRQAFVDAIPTAELPPDTADGSGELAAADTANDRDEGAVADEPPDAPDLASPSIGDGSGSSDPTADGNHDSPAQQAEGDEPAPDTATASNGETPTDLRDTITELGETVSELTDRVDHLDDRLDDHAETVTDQLDEHAQEFEHHLEDHQPQPDPDREPPSEHHSNHDHQTLQDTELTAKIIRACMNTDTIDEDEELQVIEHLTSRQQPNPDGTRPPTSRN